MRCLRCSCPEPLTPPLALQDKMATHGSSGMCAGRQPPCPWKRS